MAKFIYRMQNILNIKYKLEEQAKQQYTQVRIRFNQEEEKLNQLKIRKEEYMDLYRKLVSEHLYILEIEQCKNSIFVIDDYILKQEQVLAEIKNELKMAEKKLDESMKERKIHEKLKENEFEVFLQELNQEEIKEIDQLVSYQYNNKLEKEK